MTAEQARRLVNSWLFTQVSCMMGARTPWLVVGEHVVWRVPVVLTAPHIGEVGTVGEINVDVQTGAMEGASDQIDDLCKKAAVLSRQMPAYPGVRETPAEYIAKDYCPTQPNPTPDPLLVQKVAAAFALEEM